MSDTVVSLLRRVPARLLPSLVHPSRMPRRRADDQLEIFHIFRHNRASPDHRILPYRDAAKDCGVRPDRGAF